MKSDKFKYIFSLFFFIIAVLMILFDWFRSRIDSTIIILFLIAFTPWLAKYIKSLEAFGVKLDLLSQEKINKIDKGFNKINKETLDKKNIVNDDVNIDKKEPIGSEKNPILIESMEVIARTNNPIEKLVLIRYEIEKEIKILCRVNNIQTYQQPVRNMIKNLRTNKIIDNTVANLILDIWPILNKAVHSDFKNLDLQELDWIIEKGSALVMHLEIISKDPSKYYLISFDD